MLLLLGADVNKPADGEEYSAIHNMARFGRLEMLELVRRICGDAADLEAPNQRKQDTSLHLAAANGHVGVVRFLLEASTANAAIDVETRYGDTPLSMSARNGHLDVVCLLVAEGATINTSATNGAPPALFFAAQGRHADVVRFCARVVRTCYGVATTV